MSEKHIAEHEERQIHEYRITEEGNREAHQARGPADCSNDSRTSNDDPIAMLELVRQNINQVKYDIDSEQAIEEPQCTEWIFSVVESRRELRPFERFPVNAPKVVNQSRRETADEEIEEEERDEQLVGLAFHKIPESTVCLEETTRQKILQRHSERLQIIFNREFHSTQERKVEHYDQRDADSLGQINIFNPRLFCYWIFRHNYKLLFINC